MARGSRREDDDGTDGGGSRSLSPQNGNLEHALSYFSATSADDYRALFTSQGVAQAAQTFTSVPNLIPLYIVDLEARYIFTVTLSGQPISFEVAFANAFGAWKIRTL